MKLVTLIENTKHAGSPFANEHGLSLFFKYGGQNVLFDTGASDKFIYNATLMGIDLVKVDACVISHPHYDHTGGLEAFLGINNHAKVYLKDAARGDFYTKEGNKKTRKGLEPGFFEQYAERLQFIDHDFEVIKGVFAASINKYRKLPLYTSLMLEKRGEEFLPDTLDHELFVAIKLDEGFVVLTGCAHSGLLNILMTAQEKFGQITGVAGGFHLGSRMQGKKSIKKEPESEVYAIAKFLEQHKIKKVYTGHCTGEKALEKLSVLARVRKMRSGDVLEF